MKFPINPSTGQFEQRKRDCSTQLEQWRKNHTSADGRVTSSAADASELAKIINRLNSLQEQLKTAQDSYLVMGQFFSAMPGPNPAHPPTNRSERYEGLMQVASLVKSVANLTKEADGLLNTVVVVEQGDSLSDIVNPQRLIKATHAMVNFYGGTEPDPSSLALQDLTHLMAEQFDRAITDHVCTNLKSAHKHRLHHMGADASAEANQKNLETLRGEFKRVQDSVDYFCMPRDMDGWTRPPLERLAEPFKHLKRPETPLEAQAFDEAIKDLMYAMACAAIDQHRENPEFFVSHGFNHAINVADYMKSVLENNPELVEAVKAKYQVSEEEARFAFDLLALVHDVGYPHLHGRAKCVHGISGADLFSNTMRPQLDRIFASSDVETANSRARMLDDLYEAVLFHSADKVEEAFDFKIEANRGTFLARTSDDVAKILSIWRSRDPKTNMLERNAQVIIVNSQPMKRKLQKVLDEAETAAMATSDGPVFRMPEIVVDDAVQQYTARVADLCPGDRLVGLEFSAPYLKDNPFQVIRLVDNMDMRKNRLSDLQASPDFEKIYFLLGEEPMSSFDEAFRDLAKTYRKEEGALVRDLNRAISNEDEKEAKVARLKLEAWKTEQPMRMQQDVRAISEYYMQVLSDVVDRRGPNHDLIEQLIPLLDIEALKNASTPKEAQKELTRAAIQTVLDRASHLSQNEKDEIWRVGSYLSSYDLRHFGGCLAVTNVTLKSSKFADEETSYVEITVDADLYDQLNKTVVEEKNVEGAKVTVGVGEYQIYRAMDAFSTLRMGGAPIEIIVVKQHQNGDREEIPYEVGLIDAPESKKGDPT